MRLAILSSSRADFGIYEPLLNAIKSADDVNAELIVFGTHLSRLHGYTKDYILAQGHTIAHEIDTMPAGDSAEAIASAMGHTMTRFAGFWAAHQSRYDYVICLGDRYEMFSAVLAGLPFQIRFVHLHGGEKTLGAIDNVFRHSISLASHLHFAATESNAQRLQQLLDDGQERVFVTGSLSLDNLLNNPLLSVQEFKHKFSIDLSLPTALCTLHPETVGTEKNEQYAKLFCRIIKANPSLQFVLTLPNADTAGNLIRQILFSQLGSLSHVHLRENFGVQGYFSAMKHCRFLLGNTSSGIIEAASFGKWVLNLGDRQKGREHSDNFITLPFAETAIQQAIEQVMAQGDYLGINVYQQPAVAERMLSILKAHHSSHLS